MFVCTLCISPTYTAAIYNVTTALLYCTVLIEKHSRPLYIKEKMHLVQYGPEKKF